MHKLLFDGKPVTFVSYSEIRDKKPQFIGQSNLDEFGRHLCFWRVGDQQFVCICG